MNTSKTQGEPENRYESAAAGQDAALLGQGQEPLPVYCICKSTDENFMIQCDKCNEWFHFHCMGITQVSNEILLQFSLNLTINALLA